ncbi:hypothetical protein [Nonomuraea typhae]|uniref:SH3 domain-containing protein n=1 Tax=Nonomuraea typhae TaxID=2603600 RepID=A0ABW7Z2I6_9ACTN
MKKRIAQLALGAAAVAAMIAGTGGAAHAAGPYPYAGNDDIGRTLTVCAQDLNVRDVVGILRRGEHFTVKGFDGPHKGWVYGYAHGRVKGHGWVLNGWFCNA